jgi:hypothetical protein
VFLLQPLARAAQAQARAVHQQVQGLAVPAWLRARHLQRLGPAAQGRVVRHAQLQPEQADDGADQALGLAQCQAEHRAQGERRQDGKRNLWLAKYIFPGGYSPALSEVLPAVEASGLWVTDIEILRLHYARTIWHWRQRLAGNRDAFASLRDERFCRMTEFYLAGCELAFRRTGHMNWQMQLTRSANTLPLTRDYMLDAERAAGERAQAKP